MKEKEYCCYRLVDGVLQIRVFYSKSTLNMFLNECPDYHVIKSAIIQFERLIKKY